MSAEVSQRRQITNEVFVQNGAFTARAIADTLGLAPKNLSEVVTTMKCVEDAGITEGQRGNTARLHRVAPNPTSFCASCEFSGPRTTACQYGPASQDDTTPKTIRMTLEEYRKILEMVEEARTGLLTDVEGNPITYPYDR